jgi:hypothetical protein
MRSRPTHKIFVGKPFVRPRYTCEDNIKMYLKVTGCDGMDCIPVAGCYGYFNEPSGSIKDGEFDEFNCYKPLKKDFLLCFTESKIT